jgi:signal transduction histidine kinase
VGAVVLLIQGDLLPAALDAATRAELEAGAIIRRPQLDQEPWLLLARGCVGVLMLLATVGFTRLAVRSNDSHFAVFAVAITLLFFGQLHAIVVGALPVDYVSTADGLRLLAYVVLLHHVVTRIASEIAQRASEVERLRLSRELHDGLAQHLSLLHLSLDRLATPDRSAQEHARDLARARRLVEAAALEADQAITALRSGVITWEAFVEAVSGLAEEFAQNHEIEVELAAEGSARVLEAELQAEVVRILYEACSNAVRHGGATRITIRIAASPEWLKARIEDNGAGFDLPSALATSGVGIRSMTERLQRRGGTLSLDSTPGQGATVQVCVPLARQRVLRR